MIDQLANDGPPLFCAVVGPTAAGKTELAIELALRAGCGVLCVDAMQVYEGLDVGTAKPTPAERSRVPHYGLDLASPLENYNANRYAEAVEPLLRRAWENRRPLVLCGGSGLYFRALLEGFFEAPDVPPAAREAVRARIAREGGPAAHESLRRLDPETAAAIHPNDLRRVARALELIETAGEPVSALRRRQVKKPWLATTRFAGLKWDRRDLAERIARRARLMHETGLVEETEMLIRMGCAPRHTALQALGYRECYRARMGEISLEESIAQTAKNTVHYARRQLTWFGNQFDTHWILRKNDQDIRELSGEAMRIWHGTDSGTESV